MGTDNKILFTLESGDPPPVTRYEWEGSSTGAVIFNTDFLQDLARKWNGSPQSVYRDVLPEMVKNNQVSAYNNGGKFFIDVGTPENYQKAIMRHPILRKILVNR